MSQYLIALHSDATENVCNSEDKSIILETTRKDVEEKWIRLGKSPLKVAFILLISQLVFCFMLANESYIVFSLFFPTLLVALKKEKR